MDSATIVEHPYTLSHLRIYEPRRLPQDFILRGSSNIRCICTIVMSLTRLSERCIIIVTQYYGNTKENKLGILDEAINTELAKRLKKQVLGTLDMDTLAKMYVKEFEKAFAREVETLFEDSDLIYDIAFEAIPVKELSKLLKRHMVAKIKEVV